MGNIFNDDFRDFVELLNRHKVEYMLVGGFAVAMHGYVRATGDMDIWVNKTTENYSRLLRTFIDFRMPLFDMTRENFLDDNKFDVFSFGRSPVRIDIITKLKGLDFEMTFKNARKENFEGLDVLFLHKNDLIASKYASGRQKDLGDIDELNKL
jgi:hypothetical protein